VETALLGGALKAAHLGTDYLGNAGKLGRMESSAESGFKIASHPEAKILAGAKGLGVKTDAGVNNL